eukprot:TRINITY_DN5334_c0_g5_i1.p1 TRINITY_DN5334_c0_g5~~TRINITY_DN5334_c0_g5_i1.p1  ORF type:complete len:618 (+),score=135.74 TRINITY_DN5334_c0_g5_i1:342-2195(+)
MNRSANINIVNPGAGIGGDGSSSLFGPDYSPVMFSPRALRRPSVPSFSVPVMDSSVGLTSPSYRLVVKSPSDDSSRSNGRKSNSGSSLSRSFSAERHSPNAQMIPRGSFLVTVNSTYGSVPIRCHSWNSILDIKEALAVYLRSLLPDQQLSASLIPSCCDVDPAMIRIFSAGQELCDFLSAQESKLEAGSSLFATLCTMNGSPEFIVPKIEPWGEFGRDDVCMSLIRSCEQGFQVGLSPQLAKEGSGGTYFLRDDSGQRVAVFKPDDEEPKAPNNPRGYQGRMYQPGLRKGILSGEASLREVAAYMLDHDGFANVPHTTRVEAIHDCFCYNVGPRVPKAGSLQEFVVYDEMAGDLGAQVFDVDQVHKIAILDIRLVNTDRNDANILVKRNADKSLKLVPVDHGYCLPDFLEIAWCDWCWLDWPQAKKPFSPATLNYLKHLDIQADVSLLRNKLSIREESLKVMEICGRVLQIGAAAGLTLHEIGKIISRDNLDAPSLLEITVDQAVSLATSAKKKLRQPTLSRASSMISQCSKCLSWTSESGNDCGCDPIEKLSSASGQDQSKTLGGGSASRPNRCLSDPLDEFFWKYFHVLLNRVIAVKSAKSGVRFGRRNSCVLY